MANIQLYSDKPRYVTGWYGECNSSTDDFELDSIKDYLVGVYQINEDETAWDLYNPEIPTGIPQDFEKLIPGFMYLFVFKAGNATVTINGLVTTRNSSSQVSTNRVVDSCSPTQVDSNCCGTLDELNEQVSTISQTLATLKSSCDDAPTPTPVAQPTPTPTPEAEATPTPVGPTPISQPTPTPTPEVQATPTPEVQATPTPEAEATPTPLPQPTPTPTPTPADCSTNIKYDWLLDNGTYETRYTTIHSRFNETTLEIQDGPTVHTDAETPVTIVPGAGYPTHGVDYVFDADRNVHTIHLTNVPGNPYILYNHTGPYDQYSPHFDLNFATTHYFAGSEPHGHRILFNDGDIYRVQWAKINDSTTILQTYQYNQTQIQNVRILSSGGGEHPVPLVSINKTITQGTPATAQVTAEIRIPSQFVCAEPTLTPTPVPQPTPTPEKTPTPISQPEATPTPTPTPTPIPTPTPAPLVCCAGTPYDLYDPPSVYIGDASSYSVVRSPIVVRQATLPAETINGQFSQPEFPSSYYRQYYSGAWRYSMWWTNAQYGYPGVPQFDVAYQYTYSSDDHTSYPIEHEKVDGINYWKWYFDYLNNAKGLLRWQEVPGQTAIADPENNFELTIENWNDHTDLPQAWKDNWVIHPGSDGAPDRMVWYGSGEQTRCGTTSAQRISTGPVDSSGCFYTTDCPTPTPVSQPETTPTPTSEATPTPTSEATPTPISQPEATPTPEADATPTPEAEATPTPEAEATPTPISQPEATPTPDAEATPTPEAEATPTPISQPEATPTPEAEATPTPISQPEATPTPDAEATPTPDAEATPTPSTFVDVCADDVKICSDGSVRIRDHDNDCEFFPCDDIDVNCSDDVKMCPDGTYVGRDPNNNCEFLPCEGVTDPCVNGLKMCSDGTYVQADPDNNCEYPPCPGDDTGCDDATHQCSDGTLVTKNPDDDCNFYPCPGDDTRCADDTKLCSDGSQVGRDPDNNCEFLPCPGEDACDGDSLLCPDGTYVGRDPDAECEFLPCVGDTGECDKGLVECVDGIWVPRDPDADCEFVPCPGTTPPGGEDPECSTDADPAYVKCCVAGITPSDMNGVYEGPVPCDHDPFQFCYYHVNSPVDGYGNRKWFITTNLHVTRYVLKSLDQPDADLVKSKPQQNMSPCTPVKKGVYPFCVDWTGTGITADDCSEPADPDPTPLAQATPTPTNFEPNYTPTSTTDTDPPFKPGDPSTKPGGGTPGGGTPGGGTSGPGGGPWGPGGPGGGWDGIFKGGTRPGGRRGWPWNRWRPGGGTRRPGGGYPRVGWPRKKGCCGGRITYPGRRGCPTCGGWTCPKPPSGPGKPGGSIYCSGPASLLVRNIFDHDKTYKIVPVYGIQIGDLVRISIDGGLECYEVYDSACVNPQGYVVPNNCKQHCSTLPPTDCNTCSDLVAYNSSQFNFVDHDPVQTPATATHSFYDFTGKEYPSTVCCTMFSGSYKVYSGSKEWDCCWDGANFNGKYYFINPLTGKDSLGRSLEHSSLGHNILASGYKDRYFSYENGGGTWKPMWIHERFFERGNSFYQDGEWNSKFTGLLFPVYPDDENENDTNGRWVIQHNQWTSGSISAYSQKASDSNDEWIMKPHSADWHPHGGVVAVCEDADPVNPGDPEPWPPIGPPTPYDNSCEHGYACKVVPHNSTNEVKNQVEGLVAWESGLRVNDIIRISSDYGYGCWKIIEIVCAETEHYVLNVSPNCNPGYPDDVGGPYDGDELPPSQTCETITNHCRGVELYGRSRSNSSIVTSENLDYDTVGQKISPTDHGEGDVFGTHISGTTTTLVATSDNHDTSKHECELQIRWSDEINGERYLQARYLKAPTDASRFGSRDMWKWSTLYGLLGTESEYNLNHASWPDAAVEEDYSFDTEFEFGGMEFTLEDDATWMQLYVEIPSSAAAEYTHTVANPTAKMPMFVYFGDNDDSENLVSGASSTWPAIKYIVPPTPTPIPQPTPTPTPEPPAAWCSDNQNAIDVDSVPAGGWYGNLWQFAPAYMLYHINLNSPLAIYLRSLITTPPNVSSLFPDGLTIPAKIYSSNGTEIADVTIHGIHPMHIAQSHITNDEGLIVTPNIASSVAGSYIQATC